MKKIEKTETVTFYVARDGKEFRNRELCVNHELTLDKIADNDVGEKLRLQKLAQRLNLEIGGNEITEKAILTSITSELGRFKGNEDIQYPYTYEHRIGNAILALADEIRKVRG